VSALRGRLIETLAFLDKLFPNASSVAPNIAEGRVFDTDYS